MKRPLLLMRNKGLFGPFFGKHHKVPGLSKSAARNLEPPAPPDPPVFNANPGGVPAWGTVSAAEEAALDFDCKPYFADGGRISEWSLSGNVPPWMTITVDGRLIGQPPVGDIDYSGLIVTGDNATGPAASSTAANVVTPANVTITFDPLDQFGEVGRTINLVAGAENATGFQWFRNGQPIPGATAFVYTLPVQQSDNGAEFFCRVAGTGITKDTDTMQVTCMQKYNNLADGSGLVVVQLTLAAGLYTLSMSGSGLTTLRELTASIAGIG
jgi:hypothetical protein